MCVLAHGLESGIHSPQCHWNSAGKRCVTVPAIPSALERHLFRLIMKTLPSVIFNEETHVANVFNPPKLPVKGCCWLYSDCVHGIGGRSSSHVCCLSPVYLTQIPDENVEMSRGHCRVNRTTDKQTKSQSFLDLVLCRMRDEGFLGWK